MEVVDTNVSEVNTDVGFTVTLKVVKEEQGNK